MLLLFPLLLLFIEGHSNHCHLLAVCNTCYTDYIVNYHAYMCTYWKLISNVRVAFLAHFPYNSGSLSAPLKSDLTKLSSPNNLFFPQSFCFFLKQNVHAPCFVNALFFKSMSVGTVFLFLYSECMLTRRAASLSFLLCFCLVFLSWGSKWLQMFEKHITQS